MTPFGFEVQALSSSNLLSAISNVMDIAHVLDTAMASDSVCVLRSAVPIEHLRNQSAFDPWNNVMAILLRD